MSNAAKSFDILAVVHNYFDDPTKVYLIKYLHTLAKSFFPLHRKYGFAKVSESSTMYRF